LKEFNIALLPGDGVGEEVARVASSILQSAGKKFEVIFNFKEALCGGAAIDSVGQPLPDETLELCKNSDAVLFGAVGGPKWDDLERERRPEQAILGLRKGLDLYANLRPAVMFDSLVDSSSLKPEIVRGLDLLVLREGVSGIYFGKPQHIEDVSPDEQRAVDTMVYHSSEIRRIVKLGFELAAVRKKKLCSVDKENVLYNSRLWRKVAIEVGEDFPNIELSHMYVDNASMQLIRNPLQFDVVVTGNMFGDILSDAASMLTGSIGMLASANLGDGGFGMFEPVHGTAPDIAGQDKANPVAAIMSAAMLCRYALKLPEVAEVIENAVSEALREGYRTIDIHTPGSKKISCSDMGSVILERVGE
tara:strand:- start:13559 stop:14641 length:1083 start_codon:yes stop_codon:yes gene_type:complete